MNQLAQETSPYLRRHADNPVHWHAWNETALRRAVREDKPILLSIGYSTCHWCHVMERESFQDEEVAAYMNAHFINIKVDREERPDLDQFYMHACQLLTGQAGWPLNLFLTPDKRPFYGGTYFPPEPEGRRLSWFQALQYAAYNYYENRNAVNQKADSIIRRMRRKGEPRQPAPAQEQQELLDSLLQNIQHKQDNEQGGFGQGAKYPNTPALAFLLTYARQTGENKPADHVFFTLDHMLRGGIYDWVGGGWHRYTIDRGWKIPHFEKMLYDNALMVSLMAWAYQFDPNERYKKAIEQSLHFAEEALGNGQGGYYSALDADTEGREGEYYTWTYREIHDILGKRAETFCRIFDVKKEGNWENGRNILQLSSTLQEVAKQLEWSEAELENFLQKAFRKLAAARKKRSRPRRDEKIILSWNALQVSALIDAYLALGQKKYKDWALKSLPFLGEHFQEEGQLRHALFEGQYTEAPAFLDDYAFYVQALIKAYQLDWNTDWLVRAREWTRVAVQEFYDEKKGLFLFAQKGRKDLPFAPVEWEDAELPSANGLMADNLKRLSLVFSDAGLGQLAGEMLDRMEEKVKNDPFPLASWAGMIVNSRAGWKELAITGPDAFQQADKTGNLFMPGLVIMAAEQEMENWPLLAYRFDPHTNRFFICEKNTCKAPMFSFQEVRESLYP